MMFTEFKYVFDLKFGRVLWMYREFECLDLKLCLLRFSLMMHDKLIWMVDSCSLLFADHNALLFCLFWCCFEFGLPEMAGEDDRRSLRPVRV